MARAGIARKIGGRVFRDSVDAGMSTTIEGEGDGTSTDVRERVQDRGRETAEPRERLELPVTGENSPSRSSGMLSGTVGRLLPKGIISLAGGRS